MTSTRKRLVGRGLRGQAAGCILRLGLSSALAGAALGCGSAHETATDLSPQEGDASNDLAIDGATASADSPAPSIDASRDPSASNDAGDSGSWWRPAPGLTWQWQLDGVLDTTVDAQMYDIDMFDNDSSTIASLQSRGIVVTCYVDVGTWESGRPDSSDFPASVKGNPDPDGQDEYWLDVRSPVVQGLMQNRFVLAQQKGCSAIEPDNVDGYENGTGFPLTGADQITYNTWVAGAVHALGMSVALKNDVDQITELEPLFDFELDEQCFDYDECSTLLPFIQANKAALEVEYGDAGLATTICPQANALGLDAIIKDLDLDAWRVSCQ